MKRKRFFWAITVVMSISCILITFVFVISPIIRYYSFSTEREEILLAKVDNVVKEYQEKAVRGRINSYKEKADVVLYEQSDSLTFKIILRDDDSKNWVEVRYPAIITDTGMLIIDTKCSNVSLSTHKALNDVYVGAFCSIALITIIITTCWLIIISDNE